MKRSACHLRCSVVSNGSSMIIPQQRRRIRRRLRFAAYLVTVVMICILASKLFVNARKFIQQPIHNYHPHTSILVQPNKLYLSILPRPKQTMKSYTQLLLQSSPRGGATSDDDDDDDEDNDIDDDDDDDDDLLLDFDSDDMDSNLNVNGFGETTMIDRLMVAYTKTPPLTKMYLSISFMITLYAYIFTKNEFPNILLLQWDKIVTKLQIWRIVTSFFHFGPFGIGYIMTLQFVWVYMSTLERINHHRPYDFWIMILFGQLCMVIGYPIMKLSPKFLGHNLSTFLVYIWSRYHEGVEVNMFELFNTRAEMLPWFFLGQTFLLEGEIPILDFLGIVFGHIYHHCKTVGILRAPTQLTEWYETSDSAQYIRELYKPISSDFDVLP
jgi:Derlin-2/3